MFCSTQKYPNDKPLASYGRRIDKRPKLFHLVENSRKNVGNFFSLFQAQLMHPHHKESISQFITSINIMLTMMVHGKMDILKVLAKCISITVPISKALLLKGKSLEMMEYISIQMDHIKEVKLKMGDSMERELLLAPLDLNMRDNG